MRLIDANDVKRRGDCYPPDVRKVISNVLSHTKTVKDAVVVTRCKDCKYSEPVNGGLLCVTWEAKAVYADDYCSYGERRTDD